MDHLHKILALHDELQRLKSLGNDAMKRHKYEEAVEHYSKAVDMMERTRSKAPDRELASAIWSNRSIAFSKLKKYDEAWSDAQSCIRVYPDWYKGHVRLGKVYEAMSQPADALECYDTALEKIKRYEEGDEVFTDIITTYVLLAKKIYKSTMQDPSYHKARFLCSADCLICLCSYQKFESFLYIHEMYWDSMSEDMKKDCKIAINPIRGLKLDPYQEEMMIFCLEKGVLNIKEISSTNVDDSGLRCIIICSATSGSTKLLEYVMTNDKYKEEYKYMSATIFQHMSVLLHIKMDGLTTSENVIQVYKLCRRLNMVNDHVFTGFKNIVQMDVDEFLEFYETSKIRSFLPKEVAEVFVKGLQHRQKAENGESKASSTRNSASKAKTTSETNNNSKVSDPKPDNTSDAIKNETSDSKDVIELRKELNQLKDENKRLSSKSNADSPCDTEPPCDTESPCGAELIEDRTVKCLLREQDITLEVKLSKLAGILEKLNVIKLL